MTPAIANSGWSLTTERPPKFDPKIDDRQLVDLDRIHYARGGSGAIHLDRGRHTIRVPYLGKVDSVAILLRVQPPAESDCRIFNLRNFAPRNFAPPSPGARDAVTHLRISEARFSSRKANTAIPTAAGRRGLTLVSSLFKLTLTACKSRGAEVSTPGPTSKLRAAGTVFEREM